MTAISGSIHTHTYLRLILKLTAMKKILIPIDFGDAAVRAIQYAENVFKGQAAEIELIHVIPESSTSNPSVLDAYAIFKDKELKGCTLPYSFHVVKGVVLAAIQHAIHDLKPTVVIIGLDGGSLSKAFLKLTDCPVILVPSCNQCNGIRNIAYANDFKNIEESSALGPLLDLSRSFDANIHIIHVNKDEQVKPDNAEPAIEYYLDKVNHEYFSMKSTDIVDAIQKYIGDKKIDLLTLLLRDHGNNNLKTKGELVEQLVTKSSIPVLSLV